MLVKKSLVVISSVLTGVFLLGSIIYASRTNVDQKEVAATNVGDETYQTFLLSTNGQITTDDMYISFDNFASSQEMQLIQSFSSKDKMFSVSVPNSSISGDKAYFRNSSHSFNQNTSLEDSTHFYNVQNSGGGVAGSIHTVAKARNHIESSYLTRGLWFTLSSDVSGFLGIFSNNVRYMFNAVTNSVDSRTYYYVDVPAGFTSFNMSYVNGIGDTNTKIVETASAPYSNAVLQRINYVNVNSKTMSQYDPTGLDQYFINEYLKGFSTCLDSDINGYNAYDPYILNMMSYYHLDASLLDDVYQDDYLKSDYDDGYKTTSIRGGYVVSAKDKLDELDSRYDLKNNLIKIDQDTSDNGLIVVVISSTISLSVIMGYIFFKRIKHN